MNRQPLADLTPGLIANLEASSGYEFDAWCSQNEELILECMRVALRWRNEMDQMKEERG